MIGVIIENSLTINTVCVHETKKIMTSFSDPKKNYINAAPTRPLTQCTNFLIVTLSPLYTVHRNCCLPNDANKNKIQDRDQE